MKTKIVLRSLVFGLILLAVLGNNVLAMAPAGKAKNPYNVTHQKCENTMEKDC